MRAPRAKQEACRNAWPRRWRSRSSHSRSERSPRASRAHRARRLHDRRGRLLERTRPTRSSPTSRGSSASSAIDFATNDFEGRAHHARLQPARARQALRGDPGAPARAADRRGRARSGLPGLVALVDRDPSRARRAQPIHADDQLLPLPKPHVADGLQHDVGAHRLHRGERRDAHHPRLAHGAITARSTARSTTSIAAEMRARQRARLARQPLARRRRQPQRRASASASR